MIGTLMRAVLISLLAAIGLPGIAIFQQPAPTGALCVVSYFDVNQNGQRDNGEPPLAGVNVTLKLNNIVFTNMVIDEKVGQLYCFRGLSAADYTVSFTSPFASATTAREVTVTVRAGETASTEYGGQPIATSAPTGVTIYLTPVTRIALALGGAVITMLFMFGAGLVLANTVFRGRRTMDAGKRPRDARKALRG